MDLLDGNLVDCRFRLAEPLKDSRCVLFDAVGKGRRPADHLQNTRQMAMLVGFGGVHMKLGRRDSAALHLLEAQVRVGPERSERGDQTLAIGPGICQCANQHVSTHSGKRVEIADFHVGQVFGLLSATGVEQFYYRMLTGSKVTFFPMLNWFLRKGGRVVECGGLENR